MKKGYFYLGAVCALLMSGCTNETEVLLDEASINNEVLSDEEQICYGNEEFFGWDSSFNSTTPISRSSVNTITVYGYSSKSSSGNQKVRISNELAQGLGIY